MVRRGAEGGFAVVLPESAAPAGADAQGGQRGLSAAVVALERPMGRLAHPMGRAASVARGAAPP